MKTCPFCKNFIEETQDICHHCSRILIERVGPVIAKNINIKNEIKRESWQKKTREYLSGISKKLLYFDKKIKKYFWTTVVIVGVILIFVYSDNNEPVYNSNPISVIPDSSSNIDEAPAKKSTKDPKSYISLNNGTILSKNSSYLNGPGKLKIDNGTNLDAVAKLVNVRTNKSVITVYIKAKSIYNILKISDGNYKLFFNLGNDWNTEVKAFSINSSYEVFEETLDYFTSESKYSTFSVTLNPVIDGNAETNDVNPVEFGSY